MYIIKQVKHFSKLEQAVKLQKDWSEFQEKCKAPLPMNDLQAKRVNVILKHMNNLTSLEWDYLSQIIQQRNGDIQLTESLAEELQLSANPQWLQQQEDMTKLWPLGQQGIASIFGDLVGFGGSGAAPAQQENKQNSEVKEEAPKVAEKTNFDVELASFDSAQKIKIIKEVRQLFNLGLKEAKDLVDKVPSTLSKQMKAEEAQDLKGKLEAIGCVVNLI